MKKQLPPNNLVKATITCLLLLVSATGSYAQTKHYVSTTAAGTGDGTSWANASGDLQSTINASAAGDSVFVMNGTYNITTSISMKEGVKIYGSFHGNETNLAQRNMPATDPSVLDGGNTVTVINNDGNNLTTAAVLDGFNIRNGSGNTFGGMYNNSSSPTISNCSFNLNTAVNEGGGIYNNSSSPIISNCSFSNSAAIGGGGGIYNNFSSPTISNCSFSNNYSLTDDGGAIYNYSSSPIISNCIISGNWANDGGGMYNDNSSSLIITNCSFTGNTANNASGGALANSSSSPTISNCSFSGNIGLTVVGPQPTNPPVPPTDPLAINRGGKYNNSSTPTINSNVLSNNGLSNLSPVGSIENMNSSSPTISNCIIYGNSGDGGIYDDGTGSPTVTYSIVQGGYTGTGNSSADPLFVNAPSYTTAPFTGGDYHLQPCSPAINTGSNATAVGTTDLDGNPRIFNGTVDMGAYEYQNIPVTITQGSNTIGAAQTIAGNTAPEALTGSMPTGNNAGSFTYIWQSSTTNTTGSYTNIDNSNTQNYTPPVLTANTWYRRLVMASNICTDTSAAIQITVTAPAISTCNNNPVTLAGNDPDPYTGVWSIVTAPNNDNDMGQFDNATNPAATFTPKETGTYTLQWTITDDNNNSTSVNTIVTNYSGYTWIGAVDTVWSNAANWACGNVPPDYGNITIAPSANNPVLDEDVTTGNLTLQDNTTLSINGHLLTIFETIAGNGTLSGSATSRLTVSQDNDTLNFTNGSGILNNLTLAMYISSRYVTIGTALAIAAQWIYP